MVQELKKQINSLEKSFTRCRVEVIENKLYTSSSSSSGAKIVSKKRQKEIPQLLMYMYVA